MQKEQEIQAKPFGAVSSAPRIGVPNFKSPWMTYGLLGVLCLIFVGELVFPATPGSSSLTPSLQTLIAMGGLSRSFVFGGHEWQRLFTAPLLHGGFFHLLMNGLALYFVGPVVEILIGRAWFFALFFLGALGGSVLSLTLNAPYIVSIGASGAIMGLFAAMCLISFRLPRGNGRSRLQGDALRVLIPSLLPLFVSDSFHVDYGAHLGGALTGMVVGFFLLKTWKKESPLPRFQGGAKAIAFLGLAIFVGSLGVIEHRYYVQKSLEASIIPEDQFPTSAEDAIGKVDELLAKYPNDPRSHLEKAATLLAKAERGEVVQELQKALELVPRTANLLGPRVEGAVRLLLTQALLQDRKKSEAKLVFRPLCGVTEAPLAQQKAILAFKKQHLCDE